VSREEALAFRGDARREHLLLHERLERLTLGALVLALVGAALLGELRLTGDQSLGVGVALVAAVLFATFLVLSRRWSHAYDLPGPAIGAAALGLTAVAAAVILPFSSAPAIPSPLRVDAVLGVAWLAIGPGAAAAIAVIIGTIGSVGMWSFVVALPAVQAGFGVARGEASLPYTMTMVGFAFGGVVFVIARA